MIKFALLVIGRSSHKRATTFVEANFRCADVEVEIVDVQSLLPFDIHGKIIESLKKTNRILVVDEDVPGGGTAYMMQKVMEEQKAFDYLDTAPRTLSAKEHRPAYGIDGEFFSKPNVEQIFESIYEMMREVDVKRFPKLDE